MLGNDTTRVLLVESGAPETASLEATLCFGEGTPFEVLCVDTLDEALRRLHQERADVILLDLSKGSPLDDVARLHAEIPGVPLVALTSGDKQAGRDALALGADGYLSKEQSGRALEFALLQAIERARLRGESIYNEQRFRTLIENSTDGTLLVDADAKVLYSSPGLRRILGYLEGERLGESVFDFIHSEDVNIVIDLYGKILAETNVTVSAEVRVKHRDGSWRWVEGTAANYLSDPAVNAIVINFRDIEDRQRAEEHLRDSEKRFRALIENSTDGVILLDAAAAITYSSPGANKLLGYPDVETSGIPGFDFLHPEDVGRVLELFARVSANPGDVVSSELRAKHKDGSWHWVEAVCTNHLDDPAVGAFVINMRDITDRKKAEDVLKGREAFYGGILSHVEVGILIMGVDGSIPYSSPAADRIWQHNSSKNQMGLDFVHPDDVPRCAELIRQMMKDGAAVVSGEIRVKHGDDTYHWITAVGVNCINDPTVQGMLFVFSDITQRKTAEEKLQESEERFRALIEHSADGIAILSPDGNVLYGSPGLSRMMGYDESDTLGFSFAEFLNPEDLMPALNILGQIMPNPGAFGRLEVRGKHKDGSWHWFEARATNHANDPAVKGIVINLRDISERKKAEEALKSREEFYSKILAHVEAAISVIGIDGKVLYQSAAGERLWGRISETGGGMAFDSMHPDDLPQVLQKFGEMLQGNFPMTTVECRIKHPDGTYHWSATTGTNCLDNPVVKGFLVVSADITERKKIEDAVKLYAETLSAQNVQLEAAKKELSELNQGLEQRVRERTAEVMKLLKHKDEFIRQLGHDLKTPLTPLIALLPIVREDEKNPDSVELLDSAIENVNYMRQVVENTLKLAKINSSTITADQDVDLAAEIARVIKVRERAAQSKGIEVRNEAQERIVAKADHVAIQELLDNLLVNAVKFTHQGGTVTFSAIRDKQWVTVAIRDNGIGMTEEQLRRCFDEFYKADPSRHELESSGLGLTICKRIVEQRGGRIWAESKGIGKGSTFYFTLKLSDEENKQ